MLIVSVLQGNKYSPRYAQVLSEQCKEHGHKFICLVDHGIDGWVPKVDTLPLITRLEGWWAKLELFAPWNEDLRPFLFVDLDTYIMANLSRFANRFPDKFWMLRDFKGDRLASGMMYVPKKDTGIWQYVEDNGLLRSNTWADDGSLIAHIRPDATCFQDYYSGIYSYKYHCLNAAPVDAKVVCFHGRPKPHETDGWAKDYWRKYIDGYSI